MLRCPLTIGIHAEVMSWVLRALPIAYPIAGPSKSREGDSEDTDIRGVVGHSTDPGP